MSRTLWGLMIATGLVCGAQHATAEDYPTRPIKFLQGFAPGGNADVITRVLGDEMAKSLGQPVIAEARPGAGGNLASEQIARATPDGYAISFDPVNDFEFISTVSDFPFFIVVNAASPHRDLAELVAAARDRPGTVTAGTAGVGTGQHMCTELFATSIGTKFVHVPFRGDAGAVTALLGGNVDFIVAPGTAIFGNIEGGKFRALAISGKQRWAPLASVPTVAETVAPGFEMMAWVGVATTRGVAKPIVERLNREVRQAMAQPAVDKRLRDLGGIPGSSTPQEMTDKVAFHVKRWKEVAEKAGILPQ
jgi:tripartite-type tricarboxylate transporter receptor subunit TctC